MKNELSNAEQLLYSTVRIECESDQGISTGTGFFFRFLEIEGTASHIPAIVTNKHVVEGAIRARFFMTQADDDGNPIDKQHIPITVDSFRERCIFHPDPEVDLCIFLIGPLLHQANEKGIKVFYRSLIKDIIPTYEDVKELDAIEDILMIGYPNGIWDQVNNFPIMRRGITATHPKVNYNGRGEFMIDAACFPGSSGSPVLIYNDGFYSTRKGTTVGSRVLLLGILYAGPQFIATGEVRIMNIPTSQREVVVSSIPNNLGFVIRSNRILDFEPILESMNIK
ncbi:TPA: trypsin-like peptidase domain-containing protein [Bacillus cereus]|nr:trypsin-like peptidase domain-containing protein [Bacillus cereus]